MKANRIIIAVITVVLFSCEKSGSKPEINFNELGIDNSKTVVIGEELHMDAEIVAENKIDIVEIKIHPGGDTHVKSIEILRSSVEWEYDTVYSDFSGLRNTHFHEHIKIPGTAEQGDYHFHFSVTDMEGYQAEYESELELLASGVSD